MLKSYGWGGREILVSVLGFLGLGPGLANIRGFSSKH